MGHNSRVSKHAADARRDVVAVRSIDLPELLQVIGIDEQTREQGRRLAAILSEHSDQIFSTFYERVGNVSFAHRFAEGETKKLSRKQESHWMQLLSGRLDNAYMLNAASIGEVHRRRGVEPLLYIVGYSIVKAAFMDIIARMDLPPASKGRLVMALERFISLDMALAMVGYTGEETYAQLFAPGGLKYVG